MWLLTIVSLGVWLADQLSKLWIVGHLKQGAVLKVTSFLNIVQVRNTGIAFGLLAGGGIGKQLFLIVFGVITVVVVAWMLFKKNQKSLSLTLACGLIVGGALGNITDRIFRGNVVDFIDCHWHNYHWPAFNLADSAVTLGMVLLMFFLVRERN